jgi:hypothetical protein
MRSTRGSFRAAAAAAGLATAAILLAACSTSTSNKTEAGATTPAPTTTAAAAPTTTEPEPISAEEEEWVRGLHKLKKRLRKAAFQSGVVTRSRMLAQARVFGSCRKPLRHAPSARFERPYDIARKACDLFRKAEAELTEAAANVDASGAVLAGSPEETNFNRAFERANAHAGNAVNRMSVAVAKADAIRDSLPS